MLHLGLIVFSVLGYRPVLAKSSAWGCKYSYTPVSIASIPLTPKVDGNMADNGKEPCFVLI